MKLTFIIASQTKVIKIYSYNSQAFRSEDLKGQANGRSRASLSTLTIDCLLLSGLSGVSLCAL